MSAVIDPSGRNGGGSTSRSVEPQYLLLPVNVVFLWATLFAALALNMLPLGPRAWLPDFLMLTLVFWNVHQPRRVGILAAFLFGVAMDVHSGALLGQHALAYTCLSFFAIMIHRRLLWFGLASQALHVLPLFAAAHGIVWLIRSATGAPSPGLDYLAAPLIEAALWPAATLLLLAPQRRPVDPDQNRPL